MTTSSRGRNELFIYLRRTRSVTARIAGSNPLTSTYSRLRQPTMSLKFSNFQMRAGSPQRDEGQMTVTSGPGAGCAEVVERGAVARALIEGDGSHKLRSRSLRFLHKANHRVSAPFGSILHRLQWWGPCILVNIVHCSLSVSALHHEVF